jgi:hypothetical protein
MFPLGDYRFKSGGKVCIDFGTRGLIHQPLEKLLSNGCMFLYCLITALVFIEFLHIFLLRTNTEYKSTTTNI